MKTKSLLFTLIALLLICVTNSYAANIYGPYWITKSNEPLLPDANYASVTINDDYPITASPDPYHYLVTVTPNSTILVPGSNYGIQHFGLNYAHDPNDLNVFVLTATDAIDSKWGIDINAPSSFGPFGVFVFDGDTTGKNRRNPLRIYIGSDTPLTYTDFYVANEDLYMFACHIAGFSDMDPSSKELTSALFALPVPTLVELASFTATASNGLVKLEWVTASEVDNAGFNIYRAKAENGPYEKINDSLIAGAGSTTAGAAYVFVDENVKNRKTYYYKLEDMDFNGAATMHGPESATPRFIFRIFGR